jgi:23S rRNA (uridine2552-2'-O)-methyltransferase
MEAVDGVYFYKNSIEEIDKINPINSKMGLFGLVISDIAPNITGINAIDIENIYELNILTLDTAIKYLDKSHGSFIMKTFQNSMLKNLRKKMELSFKIVQTFKPAASKKQSGEIFLYGAYK